MPTQFSDLNKSQSVQKIQNKIFYPLILIANIGLIVWLLWYLASVLELLTGVHILKNVGSGEDVYFGMVSFVMILAIFLGLNALLFSFRRNGNLNKFLFITIAIGVIELLFLVT